MNNAYDKETHTSFPEFKYSNPTDTSQMPEEPTTKPQPGKDKSTPQIPVLSPYLPIRYRVLTQFGSVCSLIIVILRAYVFLLGVDDTRWMGPLQHVVIFDKLIIGTFLGVWYMRFLVQMWEADLALSKMEAAARGDAGAMVDCEALRKKRDWETKEL
ncbi:hypothetical protein Neosp_006236 [[Neocosmospora] mangrovei]